jgi:hypothetical protein
MMQTATLARWRTTVLGLTALLLVQGCAISTVRAPSWAVTPPVGYSYQYVTGTGAGSDVASARRAALEDAYQVLRSSGPRAYQTATFRQEFESVAQQSQGAGGTRALVINEQLRTSGSVNGTMDGTDIPRLEIVSTEIARCLRCTEYTVFVLFRFPKPLAQRRSPPSMTGLVARSLVVPGWGQMAKGQHAKGWAALALSVSGAGVALFAHQQRQRAFSRAAAATSQASRDEQMADAARRKPALLGGLAVSGGVYGVSLIDVMSSPPSFFPSAVPVPGVPPGVHVRLPLPTLRRW